QGPDRLELLLDKDAPAIAEEAWPTPATQARTQRGSPFDLAAGIPPYHPAPLLIDDDRGAANFQCPSLRFFFGPDPFLQGTDGVLIIHGLEIRRPSNNR